jgi:hypothetical protein
MAKRSSSRSGSDDPNQKRRPHPRALARRRAARRQQALGGSDRQTRALSGAVRSSPRLTVPLSSGKRARRSRGPRRARSFQTAMPLGRADTPACGRLLATALQASAGDGYRSHVDAGVSATRPAFIPQFPRSTSVIDLAAVYRNAAAKREPTATRVGCPCLVLTSGEGVASGQHLCCRRWTRFENPDATRQPEPHASPPSDDEASRRGIRGCRRNR